MILRVLHRIPGRRFAPSLRRGVATILGSLVYALPATGQLPDDEAGSRWIPGLTLHSGVVALQAKANVNSPDRGSFDNEKRPVFPFVAGELELASPALTAAPGQPRLFVHGGVEFVFDLDRSVVNDGDPGVVVVTVFDPDMDGQDLRFPPEELVIGTGSASRAKMQQLAFVAGAGISFAFPLGDRELRVKPSFEYRYDEFKVEAVLSDARSIAMDGVCPCRTTEIAGNDSQGFHAFGPGLELELDAARAGSLLFSVFASAQGYRVLGERALRVQASGNFDTGEPASVEATFERDAWSVRGGVGMRIRWSPE